MDDESPSRTALATARARAYHQVADAPLILVDPVVGRLVGVPESDAEAACDRPRRLFFAARARLAEDTIAGAADARVDQVVMLGAGMDTFGIRNPHSGVRVFEVDHPATQAWKLRRLAEADVRIPDATTLVPVDFESDSLADLLDECGFDRTRPAVFVWLGVVFYLTSEAVRSTLEYVAGQARSTTVVFDYLVPAESAVDRDVLKSRADRLAAAGEPWFSLFTPDAIQDDLRDLGFVDFEDRSAAALVDGYSGGSTTFDGDVPAALRASRILVARS